MNYQPTQPRAGPAGGGSNEPFSAEESARIQTLLRKKLGPEHVSTRQGMGNTRLSYVEGWRIISIANEIFGFSGWSSSIQSFGIDYMDMGEGGRYSVGATCVMRVTLRDGTFREDAGFGMIENVKSKGQALEKVRKEAVTDALKRAMRQFGNVLGNCVYDKEYVRSVAQVQKQPRGRVSGEALFRHSDLESAEDRGSQQAADAQAHGEQTHNNQTHSNQFQSAKTLGPGAVSAAQPAPRAPPGRERSADDSMDFDIDDAGVLDMLEDLETQRPVIHESPSPGFAHAQQSPGHLAPSRVGGAMGSARNLGFRPPPARAGGYRSAENTPERPRSFADVTSFVPASADAGAKRSHT
ncbi:DNA repair protein rad52 [Coemansia sp. RSA 2711]|nr:DNA repair protein rad52 [Coemansia sp. RSA 2711]KAJ2375813.1 DNA repair protein rad52 [Coemansia sp. RSA 2611]